MAKSPKTPKPKREAGRVKQLLELYKLTSKTNPKALVISLSAVVAILLVAFVVPAVSDGSNVIGRVLYGVSGTVTAVLVGLIIMSRFAEVVAYNRIEGQPGAVGAVLDNGFRRGWITNATPVAVNAKTRDLVYRIVGPAGIVVIGEGNRTGLQVLFNDERRKMSKVAHGVPSHFITVGTDEHSVRLSALRKTVTKLKRELRPAEIRAVHQRLSTMGMNAPIPKGIDPNRIRASKGRMR